MIWPLMLYLLVLVREPTCNGPHAPNATQAHSVYPAAEIVQPATRTVQLTHRNGHACRGRHATADVQRTARATDSMQRDVRELPTKLAQSAPTRRGGRPDSIGSA